MATTSNHQTDTKADSAARSGEAGTVDLSLLERAQQLRTEQHRLETFRQRVQSFSGALHNDVRRRVLDDYAARRALLDAEVLALETRLCADQVTLAALFQDVSASHSAACLDLEELDLRHAIGELDPSDHADRAQSVRRAIAEHTSQLARIDGHRSRFLGALAPISDSERRAEGTGGQGMDRDSPATEATLAPTHCSNPGVDGDPVDWPQAGPAGYPLTEDDGDRTIVVPTAALIVDADAATAYPLGFVNDIGQSVTNHIRIDGPGVSRRHACVALTTQGFRIERSGPASRMLVNGHALDHAVLKDGDRIEFGEARLIFRSPWRPATPAR